MVNSEDTRRVHIEAAVATSVGMVREINEDRYLLDTAHCLYVVADGMGGHAAGEVASQLAIESIARELTQPQAESTAAPKTVLVQAINAVHHSIRATAAQDPNLQGMGTTIVAAWFPAGSNSLWLAHVGDSRIYRLRDQVLEQLTEDHTLLNQALKLKKNDFDIEFLPSKHLLSQALGASEFIAPGLQSLVVQPNDLFLLCSDGLTDMLADDDIREMLGKAGSMEGLCRELVLEANERGGRDNCTVMLVRIDEV
jgi:protein phosphatase